VLWKKIVCYENTGKAQKQMPFDVSQSGLSKGDHILREECEFFQEWGWDGRNCFLYK
jgi:hypothetical protein